MSNETRQPAGVPVGGQFATTNRAETGTELATPRHQCETWQMQPSAKGGMYCGACGEPEVVPVPALLTPQLEEFLRDELANHEAMVHEAESKGRELPEDPTLASAADSLNQMPDHVLEEITGGEAAEVRAQFAALLAAHGPDAPLDLNALDGDPVTSSGVDLDAWEPGEDVDDDSLVAEELRTLRARVAEYEKAEAPAGPVYAHIEAIAEPAGFHPTKGVMPAMLACIADRGEDDMVPYLLALSSDDLGDMYDTGVGQAVDQLEYDIRHAVDQRNGLTAAAPDA